MAAVVPGIVAQYSVGSALFKQTEAQADAELTASLQNITGLDDIYYPLKWRIPRDFYVLAPPNRTEEYTQNVIFDPCRGYEFDCCRNTFGAVEYIERATAMDTEFTDEIVDLYTRGDDGSVMPYVNSRRPDDEMYLDEMCTGAFTPRLDCVSARLARRAFPALPRCWSRNDTIVADRSCRAPKDGRVIPLCMEVGVTQTAYVHDCGDDYQDDGHCGTFLEIHRPAMAEILSETRLVGVYASGYRMNLMSTTYKRAADKVLCYDPMKEGSYEVWWVQRTLYDWRVQRRMPFQVISPLCDWDYDNNRYKPYALLDSNGKGFNRIENTPFKDNNIVFSQPRVESHDGIRPGPGMGITITPRKPDTYPNGAVFNEKDPTEYTYQPPRPFTTIRTGDIEHPMVLPGEDLPPW